MLALTVIALQFAYSGTTWKAPPLVSKFLGHIAMLDVCIMGVIVTCAACHVYKEMGLEMSYGRGLLDLMLAECTYYATHALIVQVADFEEAGDSAAGAADEAGG